MESTKSFANPEFFYLLIWLPLWVLWYLWKNNTQQATIRMSGLKAFAQAKKSPKAWLRHLLFAFRVIAFGMIVIALARPQDSEMGTETKSKEGIDIVLAMDVSTSMKAQDLKPDRLEAAKEIAIDFVDGRESDRVGLVVYAGESFTQCPLTTDYKVVKNQLREVTFDLIEDGTSIGMGLATAVSRLKDSKAESKIVILLTDGVNNGQAIDPMTAAELAVQSNVKVYTIGIGTQGEANYPDTDRWGRPLIRKIKVEIDEDLLKEISKLTKGKYFRADNNQKLAAIYDEIDQLEKTEIEELKYYNYEEKFDLFALIALALLGLETLLRLTLFRSFI